jgi:CDP-glucose 4,6-dehydratase
MTNNFNNIYKNRRVLVTGHTGFKGSWLCAWLNKLGADVTGYALAPPTQPNHYECLNLDINSVINDIRDYEALINIFKEFKPEIIFHLAAQPSVLVSYKNPIDTLSTNVIGTAHVLEASQQTSSVTAVVIVTTDKCYENEEWLYGYRENDDLGGHDLYSASKACAEIVTASYRRSFFSSKHSDNYKLLVATARAGNVIGGGDWTDDRLIPDVFRAVAQSKSVKVRNPDSTRPWQHVLEPLSGYLLLGEKLLEGFPQFANAWNFGPAIESNMKTVDIINMMAEYWNAISAEIAINKEAPHEAGLLMLDSTKAKMQMGWKPVWGIETTIEKTVDWYREYIEKGNAITIDQIEHYATDATNKNITWSKT